MSEYIFDIEGDGLRDDCKQIWCASFKHVGSGVLSSFSVDDGADWPNNLISFLDDCTTLIGHNCIGYDLPVLRRIFGYRFKGKVVDTLVMSRVQNPDRPGGHSVEAWANKWGESKTEIKVWLQWHPDMIERCEKDVELQYKIYQALLKEQDGWDWEMCLAIEHTVARIINEQEENGWQFDVSKAYQHLDTLDSKIAALYEKITKELGYCKDTTKRTCARPFDKTGGYTKRVEKLFDGNVNAPIEGPFTYIAPKLSERKWLAQQLIARGWKPEQFTETTREPVLTEKGEPVPTLLEMPNSIGKDYGDWITYRQRRNTIKNLTDDTKGWLNKIRSDGRIKAGAISCGTNTGRMTHRVVVNVPKASDGVLFGKEMRELFIARPGYVLHGHDASGLELRIMAHYLNDPALTHELIHGDFHTVVWKTIEEYVHSRSNTKNIEYALIYGASDYKLGTMCDYKPMDLARLGAHIRQLIMAGIPALGELVEGVKRSSKRGWLKGLDNRKIPVRGEHSALNALFQSAGAVVMKQSLIFLDKWATESRIDYYKVGDFHDEGQNEVINEPQQIELFSYYSVNSIRKAGEHFELNCPLDAEAKVGMNWSETH